MTVDENIGSFDLNNTTLMQLLFSFDRQIRELSCKLSLATFHQLSSVVSSGFYKSLHTFVRTAFLTNSSKRMFTNLCKIPTVITETFIV
jgi:hypothetical protein